MTRPKITAQTTLRELAAIVSEALLRAGIVGTLSGGGAVALYTGNRYESDDLDFVTTALTEDLKPVLEPLGFVHTGSPRLSVFEHPETRWYLEFPPAPLAFGRTFVDVSECEEIVTAAGCIRVITPTHSVMDRLITAAVWHDPQSLEQAILVASQQEQRIDWRELDRWVVTEGIARTSEVSAFYRNLARSVPQS